MAIKVDLQSSAKLPRKTLQKLMTTLEALPREHTIGIERVKLVDEIDHPRINPLQRTAMPGLYHPKQGTQRAWLEINIRALLPSEGGLFKRLLPRIAFYNNLAAVAVSLVGQHYHLSLRHSVKKGSLESAVRAYTTKHLKALNESEHKLRARLFAPLQPTFERWARTLNRKAAIKR